MLRNLDWSTRGLARVVLWTVCGPLAVTAIAVAYDLAMLGPIVSEARVLSIVGSIGIPLIIAPPLFLFFTRQVRELAIAKQTLSITASTDGLTGCLNRGAFIAGAETMLGAGGEPRGALLVIDADNFKIINDRFGHHAGDEALVIIAAAIRTDLRDTDLVGRLGGEEFGVLLPRADFARAEGIAERIRDAIARAAFTAGGKLRALTVSVGGAMFEDAVEFSHLFHIADRRLYEAKGAGRNRIAVRPVNAPETEPGFAEAV
ncbi:MAG: GGDEF domain-containing protein [Cucumibacter sp.]